MADQAFKNKGKHTPSENVKTITVDVTTRVRLRVDTSMSLHEARCRAGIFTNAGISDRFVQETDYLFAYDEAELGVKVSDTEIVEANIVNVS